MYLIAIVWTCVIIVLPQAESGKHLTSQGVTKAAKTALEKCITAANQGRILNSVRDPMQPLRYLHEEKTKQPYICLVQAVANRLVSKEPINWPAGKDPVEIYTILAFTFMIFKKLEIKNANVGKKSDEDLANEFFNNSDRLNGIKDKLPKVAVHEDVLEIGYGVRIERPLFYGDTFVHVCLVFFTTNDLLANIIPSNLVGGVFNAATTLHTAHYTLKLCNGGKDVLFSSNTLFDGSYKTIVYQLIKGDNGKVSKIQRVDEYGRVLDKEMLGLSGVQWGKLAYENSTKVSYGFGSWLSWSGKQFLIIFSHSHNDVNVHPEMPVGKDQLKREVDVDDEEVNYPLGEVRIQSLEEVEAQNSISLPDPSTPLRKGLL